MSVFGELLEIPARCATERGNGLDDVSILRLWRRRLNTKSIARVLRVPECEVANRLAVLRDLGAR